MIAFQKIQRFRRYYKDHGFLSLIRRTGVIFWRTFLQKKTILFYTDLADFENMKIDLPENVIIERKDCEDDIIPEDITKLTEQRGKYRGRGAVLHQMKERLRNGARLWLIRVDGHFAGFLWSMRSGTVAPFYFPLTNNDVVIFDIETFSEFRGRGLNPLLMNFTMYKLKREGVLRFFICVNVWNKSSIHALRKTCFGKFGVARKFHVFNKNFVIWHEM